MSHVQPTIKPLPIAERIHEWLKYDGPPERPSAPKLSRSDREVWARWQAILSKVLKTGVTWADARAEICSTFDISDATYFRDVRGISLIYPQLVLVSREMRKVQLQEMAMEAWKIAREKKNVRDMNGALKNLITLDGFDRDEPDRIDPDKLNPGIIPLVMDDESRKALQLLVTSNNVLDLTPDTDPYATIDVTHEEVKDENPG